MTEASADSDPERERPHLVAAATPRGPLSGPRGDWRRWIGTVCADVNVRLYPTALGRLFDRRLRRDRELVRREIELPGWAAGLDGLTVAFLSDLHAGHFLSRRDLEGIADELNVLAPELVFLGGDLINTHWEEVHELEGFLDRIRAPLGIFAVPGNHEYYKVSHIPPWMKFLEDRGVHVLFNRGARVRRADTDLWIGGVDDLTEGEPDLDGALDGQRPGENVLLLSHHPDVFDEASERAIDLQLSGHTHGGQIRLGRFAPITHSVHGYVQGLHQQNGARLYISRGVGVTVVPLRVGAPAEVSFLRLIRQKDGSSTRTELGAE